jgi:hypothetical protein
MQSVTYLAIIKSGNSFVKESIACITFHNCRKAAQRINHYSQRIASLALQVLLQISCNFIFIANRR